MSRKVFGVAALAVCAVLLSFGLTARAAVNNLYAWVEGVNLQREDAAYGIKPAEPVDVEVGEEVKVGLWAGTVSDDDREVRASFHVAAGRDKIQITGSGGNWVRVRVKGGSGGIAQLGYDVEDGGNLPPGLRSGRITFEID